MNDVNRAYAGYFPPDPSLRFHWNANTILGWTQVIRTDETLPKDLRSEWIGVLHRALHGMPSSPADQSTWRDIYAYTAAQEHQQEYEDRFRRDAEKASERLADIAGVPLAEEGIGDGNLLERLKARFAVRLFRKPPVQPSIPVMHSNTFMTLVERVRAGEAIREDVDILRRVYIQGETSPIGGNSPARGRIVLELLCRRAGDLMWAGSLNHEEFSRDLGFVLYIHPVEDIYHPLYHEDSRRILEEQWLLNEHTVSGLLDAARIRGKPRRILQEALKGHIKTYAHKTYLGSDVNPHKGITPERAPHITTILERVADPTVESDPGFHQLVSVLLFDITVDELKKLVSQSETVRENTVTEIVGYGRMDGKTAAYFRTSSQSQGTAEALFTPQEPTPENKRNYRRAIKLIETKKLFTDEDRTFFLESIKTGFTPQQALGLANFIVELSYLSFRSVSTRKFLEQVYDKLFSYVDPEAYPAYLNDFLHFFSTNKYTQATIYLKRLHSLTNVQIKELIFGDHAWIALHLLEQAPDALIQCPSLMATIVSGLPREHFAKQIYNNWALYAPHLRQLVNNLETRELEDLMQRLKPKYEHLPYRRQASQLMGQLVEKSLQAKKEPLDAYEGKIQAELRSLTPHPSPKNNLLALRLVEELQNPDLKMGGIAARYLPRALESVSDQARKILTVKIFDSLAIISQRPDFKYEEHQTVKTYYDSRPHAIDLYADFMGQSTFERLAKTPRYRKEWKLKVSYTRAKKEARGNGVPFHELLTHIAGKSPRSRRKNKKKLAPYAQGMEMLRQEAFLPGNNDQLVSAVRAQVESPHSHSLHVLAEIEMLAGLGFVRLFYNDGTQGEDLIAQAQTLLEESTLPETIREQMQQFLTSTRLGEWEEERLATINQSLLELESDSSHLDRMSVYSQLALADWAIVEQRISKGNWEGAFAALPKNGFERAISLARLHQTLWDGRSARSNSYSPADEKRAVMERLKEERIPQMQTDVEETIGAQRENKILVGIHVVADVESLVALGVAWLFVDEKDQARQTFDRANELIDELLGDEPYADSLRQLIEHGRNGVWKEEDVKAINTQVLAHHEDHQRFNRRGTYSHLTITSWGLVEEAAIAEVWLDALELVPSHHFQSEVVLLRLLHFIAGNGDSLAAYTPEHDNIRQVKSQLRVSLVGEQIEFIETRVVPDHRENRVFYGALAFIDIQALTALGHVQNQLGQEDKAAQTFERAVVLLREARASGTNVGAIYDLEQWIKGVRGGVWNEDGQRAANTRLMLNQSVERRHDTNGMLTNLAVENWNEIVETAAAGEWSEAVRMLNGYHYFHAAMALARLIEIMEERGRDSWKSTTPDEVESAERKQRPGGKGKLEIDDIPAEQRAASLKLERQALRRPRTIRKLEIYDPSTETTGSSSEMGGASQRRTSGPAQITGNSALVETSRGARALRLPEAKSVQPTGKSDPGGMPEAFAVGRIMGTPLHSPEAIFGEQVGVLPVHIGQESIVGNTAVAVQPDSVEKTRAEQHEIVKPTFRLVKDSETKRSEGQNLSSLKTANHRVFRLWLNKQFPRLSYQVKSGLKLNRLERLQILRAVKGGHKRKARQLLRNKLRSRVGTGSAGVRPHLALGASAGVFARTVRSPMMAMVMR